VNEQTKYIWKKFEDDSYKTISVDSVETLEHSTTELSMFEGKLNSSSKTFQKLHQVIAIPKVNDLVLNNLLAEYNLGNKEQLLTLGCSLQELYSSHYNAHYDDLSKDFDAYNEEYVNLLEAIEKYLFAPKKAPLDSIAFKMKHPHPSVSIKNFFVLDDVYEAICIGFDITGDNFETRKKELIGVPNKIKFFRYDSQIKKDFIKSFYEFVEPIVGSKSIALKVIGTFLHIFEIPSNNKEFDGNIELYIDINEQLKSIDIKNLRHALTR
jgi:hypothetical protein